MKGLGLAIVGLLVFLLGLYGGYIGANIVGMAMQPAAVHAEGNCADQAAELEARAEALRREQVELRELLYERYVAAGVAPMRHPADVIPATSLGSLARATFADLRHLHCVEYPCIAVVGQPLSEVAQKGLADAHIEATVYDGHGLHAVVLAAEGYPAPPRTEKRAAALLRFFAR